MKNVIFLLLFGYILLQSCKQSSQTEPESSTKKQIVAPVSIDSIPSKSKIITKIDSMKGHPIMYGTYGCIPKTNFLLMAGKFFEITKEINNQTYFYILFGTAITHNSDGSNPVSYTPAFLRSTQSMLTDWNNALKLCTYPNFGVGICDIGQLKTDGDGWYYFEKGAFFCNEVQNFPPPSSFDCKPQHQH